MGAFIHTTPDSKQQNLDKIEPFCGHIFRARVCSIGHLQKFAKLGSEIWRILEMCFES